VIGDQRCRPQITNYRSRVGAQMRAENRKQTRLDDHIAQLFKCHRCPRMKSTPVSGGAIVSDVMIIGQAPGPREPVLQRPFAHTAGRTLFRWFEEFCGISEAAVRSKVYFAAVCRCFPEKILAAQIAFPIRRKFAIAPRGWMMKSKFSDHASLFQWDDWPSCNSSIARD
jgi:hypothetical protein